MITMTYRIRCHVHVPLLLIMFYVLVITNSVNAAPSTSAELKIYLEVPQMITLDPSADETNFSETDFYEFGIYQPEGILLTKDNMLSVEVKGNLGYRVLISALSNSLIGPVGETLPMAQLRWRLHSEEDKTPRPWQPISTKSVLIIERTGAGLIEFSLDFQILATWDVAPAVYKGMILLTVIPQD